MPFRLQLGGHEVIQRQGGYAFFYLLEMQKVIAAEGGSQGAFE
jgi:hypothetical protein